MAADYYALLGVRSDASDEEIKRAYRSKARELHPDRTGGDAEAEARFKEVSLAYEVLRDPERRARYDRFGPEGVDATMGPMADFFGGGLGSVFDAFFGGSRPSGRRSGPIRGPDAEVGVELDLREVVFGVHREISVDQPVSCDACGGSGARAGTTAVRCPDCQGTGELRRVRQSILGQVVTAVPCQRCGGLGEAITSPCPKCAGDGRLRQTCAFTVEVPPGVDEGSTLRLTGRGPAGPRGGPPGDLYVHLAVRADERFTRYGDDLEAVLPVSMTQAALGASIVFETIDGPQTISVAPGTHSGTVIRLRGHGVPLVRGRGRGDLLVRVAVETPSDLTKSQEELLRRLAAERGEDVAPPDDGFLSRLRSAFG